MINSDFLMLPDLFGLEGRTPACVRASCAAAFGLVLILFDIGSCMEVGFQKCVLVFLLSSNVCISLLFYWEADLN